MSSGERLILPDEFKKEKKLRKVHAPFYRQLVVNLAKALGIVLAGAVIVLLTQYGYNISPILSTYLSGVSVRSLSTNLFATIANTTTLKLLLSSQTYTVEFTVSKCLVGTKNCTKGLAVYSRKGLDREYYLICMSGKCEYYEAILINPEECLLSVNGTHIRVAYSNKLSIPFIYYCKVLSVTPSFSGFCITCNVGMLKNVVMCFSNAIILYKLTYRNGTYVYTYVLRNLISPKMYVNPRDMMILVRKLRS